jgi:membrane-bound metal-dependent hydrolase YbcI (DUF457 family)
MYITSHLTLGLIIGELSGNYTAALLGSLLIDVDHLIPMIEEKSGITLKKIWEKGKQAGETGRSYLHGIFPWILLSSIALLFNFNFALIFSLAYLGHLLLDALDKDDFYPFYPIKRVKIKGFIPYYSRKEFAFNLFLVLILVLIFL